MRISSSQIYSIANIGMRDAQVAVDKTNQQINSGKRVTSPSDDPVAATSILTLNQELSRTSQFKKNIDAADNSLSLEETTLQSAITLVQRLREVTVKAGNTAIYTPADYKSMAAEFASRVDELMNLQNTRNSSGQYIFSGYQSETIPFISDGSGNYIYQGDEGQLKLQASTTVTIPVSDSGKRLFMDIPSSHNTFATSANPANKSYPAAMISVGDVVDQTAFDKLFPNNMIVTFNANASVIPPSPNYTVTESPSGKVITANQVYISGQDITVNGAKFAIYGTPYAGVASVPANLPVSVTPTNFTPAPLPGLGASTFQVSVGGMTETFTIDQNITNMADLVTALGGDLSYPITAPASELANQKKLQNLGITFDAANGFSSPAGLNITLKNGDANIDNVFSFTPASGITAQGSGITTPNIPFNFGAAYNFSLSPETIAVTVNGKTENLTLNTNVTDAASLSAALNSVSNAAALARLGVTASPLGFSSANNSTITLSNGGAEIFTAMGLVGNGVLSSKGILASPGDSFKIESTNTQGLLTTAARFTEALKNVDNTQKSKDEFSKIVAKTLANLENSISTISSAQSEVGARQNLLQSTMDLHADTELYSQKVLSQLEDLDYAEASTRLQMQTFVLSASQQTFVKISEMNLFKYM